MFKTVLFTKVTVTHREYINIQLNRNTVQINQAQDSVKAFKFSRNTLRSYTNIVRFVLKQSLIPLTNYISSSGAS